MRLTVVLLFFLLSAVGRASDLPTETHHYAIEIAGIRVGTMTAVRQPQANHRNLYTLISDVRVKLLVYTITIYYKVINQFEGQKLLLSTVDAHTNRGTYASRTEWQNGQYTIRADQYKYKRQATEPASIDFTISSLYFEEPIGRSRVFAEYFGDYFTLRQLRPGTYRAQLDGREDDYIYEKGQLVKVIKHNAIKNFVIQRLD